MPLTGLLMVIGISGLAVGALFVVAHYFPVVKRQEQNEVLGFVYAVVGVIYAVVLAMTVIGVWEELNVARGETYKEATALTEVYWYATSLPKAEHDELQGAVKEYTHTVIDQEWPMLDKHKASDEAWAKAHVFRGLMESYQPDTIAGQTRYEQALTATRDAFDARRARLNEADEGIPMIFWVGLFLGAAVTVGFAFMFGMSSMKTHAVVVFSLTALMAFMLLLVYVLNYPFSGTVRIGPEAFDHALNRMALIP